MQFIQAIYENFCIESNISLGVFVTKLLHVKKLVQGKESFFIKMNLHILGTNHYLLPLKIHM